MDDKFSWVKTHQEIVEYLKGKEDDQKGLIDLLKSVGITPFNDKTDPGDHTIELNEIDPFTFFCYIYKYGGERRLKNLEAIADKLNLYKPSGHGGIPSTNAQKVWMFPYKYMRTNNEIPRLWNFFRKALNDEITGKDFEDILQIRNIGKTKITETLFYIDPVKYFPINGPSKPYLKEELGIDPKWNTYSEYKDILNRIKAKVDVPFYEVSYDSWQWMDEQKQISPKTTEDESGQKYWLYAPGESAREWDEFYEEGVMGLGWAELGDLNQYISRNDISKKLRQLSDSKTSQNNNAKANLDFRDHIHPGDVVIIKKGRHELLGYGIVTSDYYYDPERTDYPHLRKVDWKLKGNWKAEHNLVIKTLTDITEYDSDHPDYDKYYERLMGVMKVNQLGNQTPALVFPLNTILYGPPGTGKTYNTISMAAEIVENRTIDSHEEATRIFNDQLHDQVEFITFHQNYSYEDFIQGLRPDTENDSQLTFERKDGIFKIMADRAMKNITESKHPKVAKKPFGEVFQKFLEPLIEGEVEEIEVKMRRVSYFITGITNKSIDFRKASGGTNHTLSINTLNKMYDAESVLEIQGLSTYYQPLLDLLLKMGKDSKGEKEYVERKNFVLIIDEINRANISRVFGELITLIEPDKRSEGAHTLTTTLPSGEKFTVPSNLYIIGTMNTADKSIALLDIALRRRFRFIPMYPIYTLPDKEIYNSDILRKINMQIIKSKGHDFQIGHSYFMGENGDLISRMNHKVIPLLLEYFMNDTKEVGEILTSAGLEIDTEIWPLAITGLRD